MWAGVSGLQAHSEQMGVIGNNLANVNTVGYKSSRMDFEDLVYANISTAGGLGQVGEGVRVGAIQSDFSQGGFQTTNNATDMAISGMGFFNVKDRGTQTNYYTRAGNFNFDRNGYLVDAHNFAVQGWQVNQGALKNATAQGQTLTQVPVQGSVTDVRLDTLALAAQNTSNMTVISNLDPTKASQSTSTTNPFFSMFQNYNFNPARPSDPALADTSFGFQNTLKVYDQRGGAHNATIYYDKVSDVGGKEYWEYMVTCDPTEDGRQFTVNGNTVNMASNSKAGVLMMGSMVFNDSGKLQNITSYTLNSSSYANSISNLSDWTLAKISGSGYPVFTANFRSVSGGSVSTASNAVSIALNVGIRNSSTSWGTSATSADMIGFSHLSNAAALQGYPAANITINNLSTTNFQAASSTLYVSQDGFPPGTLQSVSVDTDGVLSGRFSNGQVQALYVISLADFASTWGLKRDGGNLFSQTRESGDALIGRANTGRLGSLSGSSLETSNVDMASEMVQMIQTQRGFEANSKTITTADTMLSEVIQLKR